MAGKTLYDKLWDSHVVREQEDGTCLLYIDRHLVHEVTSPQAFEGLRLAGRKPWRINANLATPDHNVPTTDREKGIADPISRLQVETLDQNITTGIIVIDGFQLLGNDMNIGGSWIVRVVILEQLAELSAENRFALLKDTEHLFAEFGFEIAANGLENIAIDGYNHRIIRSRRDFSRLRFRWAFFDQTG